MPSRSVLRRLSALALAAALAGAPAWAQEPAPDPNAADEARGRELYENGALLYEEGRYEDAIFAWTEGYRLTGRSGFLFNVANAQERLGRYADAIDTLGRYRALAPAEEREVLERRIRNLEARLAESEARQAALPPPVPAPAPAPAPVPVRERGGSGVVRWVAGGGLVAAGLVGLGVGAAAGLRSGAAGREALAQCVDGAEGPLCPATASEALRTNRTSAVVRTWGSSRGRRSAPPARSCSPWAAGAARRARSASP